MKKYILLILLILSNCHQFYNIDKLLELEDYNNAILECHKIIASDSLNVRAHFTLGECYLVKGEINNANKSFSRAYQLGATTDQATKIKSSLMKTTLLLGDSLLHADEPYRAEKLYLSVYTMDSLNISCLHKISNLYYDQGNLDDARVFYEKIGKISPLDSFVVHRIDSINSRSSLSSDELLEGIRLFKDYKYQTSIKHFVKSLRYKPDNIDSKYYKVMAEGAILYSKGTKKQLWDSIEFFGNAMMYRPDSGEPHFYLGMAYEKKDRHEFVNAIEHYRLALEKEPLGYFADFCAKKITELTTRREQLHRFWNK